MALSVPSALYGGIAPENDMVHENVDCAGHG